MMQYDFPVITHIDQVLAAIEGRDEFIVKHDVENGYKVVNYLVNYQDTFPEVKTERDALLRECRGITFCADTGKVLSRKYHKFFNLNERPETLAAVVDMTQPHVLLEKLDGSMITFMLKDGKVVPCTKLGMTDIAKQVQGFIDTHPNYVKVIKHCIDIGQTPIFEWCSRQQRIVVDYPEDRLVLTAIRVNETGEYLSHDSMGYYGGMHDIDVVKPHSGEIQDDEEGYVIRFDDGHMLKVKGEVYCALHRTLEHFNHEKDVIRLILDDKLDDVKGVLPVDLASKADAFTKQIFDGIVSVADTVYWIAQAEYDNLNGSRKRFAIEVANGHEFSSFLFSAFKMLDEYPSTANGQLYVHNLVKEYVKKQCGSQTNVNRIRNIIGSKTWQDYVNIKEE